MLVGIPREIAPGERRVAMVPEIGARLVTAGFELAVESGAGAGALHDDAAYQERGISVVPNADELYANADIVCKVQPPNIAEVARLREHASVVSFLQPGTSLELVEALKNRNISAFSLDLLPRISRGQSMDALSHRPPCRGTRRPSSPHIACRSSFRCS